MHYERNMLGPLTAVRGGGWRRYFRSWDKSKKRHAQAGYFKGLFLDIRSTLQVSWA